MPDQRTNPPQREIRPEFAPYLGLLDFLGALLGPRTEIVLHDVSDLSRSIIAVVNGEMSGRSVGGPATDLVLKILQNREYLERDYLTNYLAQGQSGGYFRSSTYFIRDERGEVIGMLCLNVDDGPLHEARKLLEALTQTTGLLKSTGLAPDARSEPSADEGPHEVAERLTLSVDELTHDSVARTVARLRVEGSRMTQEEKLEAVSELDAAGIFLMKGSVAHAAHALHVSEPTIYRYLKQLRTRGVPARS
ncbi:transcriptional regulator [Subtercola sp. Z020]|uniref:helix-turn-helix transcriptional regulator n=1 Tax=Subtercola sp. Z020 TaxID=2080582 RepID=UPI00130EC89C|nr:PAS domain-containing protein [Subtercola sp. Z020]